MIKKDLNTIARHIIDNYLDYEVQPEHQNYQNQYDMTDDKQKLGPANAVGFSDLYLVANDHGEYIEGGIDMEDIPDFKFDEWVKDSRMPEQYSRDPQRLLGGVSRWHNHDLQRARKIRSAGTEGWGRHNPNNCLIVDSPKYGTIMVPPDSMKDWRENYTDMHTFDEYYEMKLMQAKIGIK